MQLVHTRVLQTAQARRGMCLEEKAASVHSRYFHPKVTDPPPPKPHCSPQGWGSGMLVGEWDAGEEGWIPGTRGSHLPTTCPNSAPPATRPHAGHQVLPPMGLTSRTQLPLCEGEEEGLNWLGRENTAQARLWEKICPFKYKKYENYNSGPMTLLRTVGRKEGKLSLISILNFPIS